MTSDKTRKTAARALAAQQGISYTAALRRMNGDPGRPASVPPPPGVDPLREYYQQARVTIWTPEQHAHEARRATLVAGGRAWHLADRYPPLKPKSHYGFVFGGTGVMSNVLALELLYLVALHEQPDLWPDPKHLAWVAELADTDAVDAACAELDRAARLVVDGDHKRLHSERIPAALEAGRQLPDRRRREEAARVASGYHQATKVPYGYNEAGFPQYAGVQIRAARQVLDATLTATSGGYAPGNRVEVSSGEHTGATGLVIGIEWAVSGPPAEYVIEARGTFPGMIVPAEHVRLAPS
ncbi:hypothetical protein AB0M47_21010 [Hamadaea sp. NPDC051192]|uniref:hypothetical protein n=1 Tax=Hamadaea sp. NPDC051192 TaxID=3154940 RepID=UPI003437984D